MPTATVEASPAASAMAHDHPAADAPAAPSSGLEVAASIKLFMFSPEPLEVAAGTTVIWTNQDDIEHSVTSGAASMADGAFDSEFFTKGQTYAFTFSQPGEYSYFCKRHPSMTGTVKVR
jgi:plastocyanin